ncbi:hypothetical protein HMPREF3036_01216 [Sutterella sp. KLE1602]|nr:hypothetical protein HMPREF3036_01216 [Sutterella sp. KLE1602]
MTRLESAPSGIDAARSRVMTRILSRFHRFLCPPPHWRSVGLKPILFNRRPGTRRTEPSPRRPRRPTGPPRCAAPFSKRLPDIRLAAPAKP